MIDRLLESQWSGSETERWLLPLRTLQISLIRHGLPSASTQQRLVDHLEPLYPQDSFAANWLLQELLVKLRSPQVLAKSLDLLESASTQEEQIQYAKTLTHIDWGWDRDAAVRIVAWLVRNWTIDDLVDEVNAMRPEDRSIAGGQKALAAGLCLRCHRVGERGSPVGPDLSQVGKRFDGRALLESIIDPSRQVDPKYFNSSFLMSDGRIVTGRTVGVSKNQLTIETDPMTARAVVIDRGEIEMSLPANRSPMPDGLLDTLTRDEVLDLIALLRR